MTEPKKFHRGKRTYTKWGANFKEVRVEGGKKEESPQAPPPSTLTVDLDPLTETGVYSNLSAIHRTSDEVILDFVFLPPRQTRGRIRSRVVVPFQHVHKLAEMLKQVSDEIKKSEGR